MPRELHGAANGTGEGFRFLPREALLTFEELTRAARAFARLGVRKLRLTGGEPLLRAELPELVAMLREIPGIEDIALTTNGSRLAAMAEPLARAGLRRVTVSLDALDDERFRAITDSRDSVRHILAGIDAAAAAGLTPVKVNCVVRRGANEDQVLPLAQHFRGTGHVVRFIEYMDVGGPDWTRSEVVSGGEILKRISERFPLVPVEAPPRGEVATRWRYADGAGEVGIITSVTAPFCRDCQRARLSSEGVLYTCLFATSGSDLRHLLRGGASEDALAEAIARLWSQRTDRYSELRRLSLPSALPRVAMSHIGG